MTHAADTVPPAGAPMRALVSVEPGPPEALRPGTLPCPEPGPGQILIAVAVAAVNFPDVLVIEDRYQIRPERPFAPGNEVAGRVAAVGQGVTRFRPGDRVFATGPHGGLAEFAVRNEHMSFHLPEPIDWAVGASLLMTYATTIYGLTERSDLGQGQTLLVLGAAGGVGLAAVDIGKALGARVIAAVSSREKAELALRMGAEEAVVYPRGPLDRQSSRELAEAFKAAMGPRGADVIYDPVGGDYVDPAIRAIAWGGHYLVVGFTAGIPKLALNLALLKGCDVRGVYWGPFMTGQPEENARLIERLLGWYVEGRIGPAISRRFPLERGAEAIRLLADRGATGKIVVEVNPGL